MQRAVLWRRAARPAHPLEFVVFMVLLKKMFKNDQNQHRFCASLTERLARVSLHLRVPRAVAELQSALQSDQLKRCEFRAMRNNQCVTQQHSDQQQSKHIAHFDIKILSRTHSVNKMCGGGLFALLCVPGGLDFCARARELRKFCCARQPPPTLFSRKLLLFSGTMGRATISNVLYFMYYLLFCWEEQRV